MSRPRTPFGPEQPGRLAGTMIRVLATEMSDPGRLARGKRYWSDRAVIDIVVGHGAVTAEVQGSRPLPYVVTLETRAGKKAPTRRDVTVRCTCPDDDGTGRSACKHAVAAMFALADEVSIDPDVLSRWRRSDSVPDDTDHSETHDAELDDGHDRGARDATIHDLNARRTLRHQPRFVEEPPADVAAIDALLGTHDGPRLPPVPTLAPAEHPPFPDDLVADVLADARVQLHVRWE